MMLRRLLCTNLEGRMGSAHTRQEARPPGPRELETASRAQRIKRRELSACGAEKNVAPPHGIQGPLGPWRVWAAPRSSLKLALLLILLLPSMVLAATPAERAVLTYDINLGGLGVAQAELDLILGPNGYRVESQVTTQGFLGRILDFTTTARSTGTWQPAGPQPDLHYSDTVWRGEARRVEITYDAVPPRAEVTPQPSTEDREPVPEDARTGTIDPLSGVLALLRSTTESPPPTAIYDGRRLYTLALDALLPAEVSSAAYSGAGWRGVLDYDRKFGRSTKPRSTMFRSRSGTGSGSADIHLAPGAALGLSVPVPVRIEVPTSTFGSLVVLLTNVRLLPADQTACEQC